MAKTIVYNGSFEGFLCAVFDVYDQKLGEVTIVPAHKHQPSLFAEPHLAGNDPRRADRVWKGLQKKLTADALEEIKMAFLSEAEDMENTLLAYIQYVFSTERVNEKLSGNSAALVVSQTAKKVLKERQHTEVYTRFQQTTDGLHIAVIEPAFHVLPLVVGQFQKHFAGQRWLLYDARRRYGVYGDKPGITPVQLQFANIVSPSQYVVAVVNENELLYRQLWTKYFKNGTKPNGKNPKLQILKKPRTYRQPLAEPSTTGGGGLQERLTNWTYRRA
ncbi:MAG TPA: TIGR03915 family putative DNA repair protein [Flavisolibacter sp.]|nr:TIGR03915 family putative DNA repair protein [Flavisolibacter sp.]